MKIGIIGAGASGMAAALAAAENPEVEVLVLERQSRVGRKLLATGNGRCNLTNLHALEGGYHGESPDFSKEALTRFSPEETLAWFRSLGLYTVAEPSGRVYPYSDQANSVVDVLRLAMDKPNITLVTGFTVEKIRREPEGFTLSSREDSYFCDKVIVACGGLAGSKLGGTMSGYQLLGKLGHRSTRLRPALVQIKCGWGGIVGLKGVRANCHVKILRDEALFAQSTGELQFTEMGLSGPVIFEISRDVCFGKGDWEARLDFLPEMSQEELEEMLLERQQRNFPMEELLTGILHNRLGRVLTKAAGIGGRQAGELTREEIAQVCRTVKDFDIPLTEPLGMDSAQVTAGGVLTENFDPQTLESCLVPGLYACGEVLDVDGDCGGYNLQWAWSSGRTAGLHAGKESV
ncbi:MAG TPA: aminoacetone oxidase family FAD-binding enzyme [Candidatus Faecousia excrementigallinarum]|uniref:Aminoacetone oxidase family FAD-binding enzyme n=1 Tax=Candidatus Faecousia excrementigallinarum TaxID=2840806 RepID=A0A9D0Z3C2_9FIRM|nr:aminoacetone oxidase family FAD-binding enzyme [Candidatus Faecousia excrementigallinarum]